MKFIYRNIYWIILLCFLSGSIFLHILPYIASQNDFAYYSGLISWNPPFFSSKHILVSICFFILGVGILVKFNYKWNKFINVFIIAISLGALSVFSIFHLSRSVVCLCAVFSCVSFFTIFSYSDLEKHFSWLLLGGYSVCFCICISYLYNNCISESITYLLSFTISFIILCTTMKENGMKYVIQAILFSVICGILCYFLFHESFQIAYETLVAQDVNHYFDLGYSNQLIRNLSSKLQPIGEINLTEDDYLALFDFRYGYANDELCSSLPGFSRLYDSYLNELNFWKQNTSLWDIEHIMPSEYITKYSLFYMAAKFGYIPAAICFICLCSIPIATYYNFMKKNNIARNVGALSITVLCSLQLAFYLLSNLGWGIGSVVWIPGLGQNLILILLDIIVYSIMVKIGIEKKRKDVDNYD